MTTRASHTRWWILLLLFAATVINYVDRQSLSILATTIQRVFGLSDIAYGHIVMAFLFSYTIAYVVAGPLTDRMGVRSSMALFICWWSLAEMLPALARSGSMLGAARFLLGLGEAGVWVAGPKAVAEMFRAEQRALAVGLYTSGSMLGATIAPPLVAGLALRHGWASVFLATGAAGLIWLLPWLLVYRIEGRNQDRNQPPSAAPQMPRRVGRPWLDLLASRNMWLLMLARMLADPVWYFYLFWYPKYMSGVRHLSLKRLGHTVWVVYLAADLGAIFGGWVSGWMIQRGHTALGARRMVMTAAALLLPLSPLVALLPSTTAAMLLASLIAFAQMGWLITLSTMAIDVFPQRQLATAFGWVAAGSGIGGLLSTGLIARSVEHSGYLTTFCVMGLLHPLALIMIWLVRAGGAGGASPAAAPGAA